MTQQPPGDPETRFWGQPETRWLTSAPLKDREMLLTKDFWYDDWAGQRWTIDDRPIDGASIPRALWSVVGSPYCGRYRRASIVHDVACRRADSAGARKLADKMFYQACRDGGCSKWQARVLYIGVRIGSLRWQHGLVQDEDLDVRADETDDQRDVRHALKGISDRVDALALADDDDIDAIDLAVIAAGNAYLAQHPEQKARVAPLWT